jgi:hypothetical protein
MRKRKTAKAIYQYEQQKFVPPFLDIIAECSNCGATVVRNLYGKDEYCPECDAELDWSVEE